MNERSSLLYRLGVLHHSIRYYQQFGVSPEENDQLLQATQNLTGTKHKTLCDALSEIEIKMAKLKRENDRGQP
jgi:triphosphoribosyl-dephospho-CoA synthetase